MCDYRTPASRFSEGAHQGIALKVMNFRSSGACQSKPWLPWATWQLPYKACHVR